MLALWKQSLKYLEDGQTYRATSFWQKQFTTWIDESIEPTSILFTYQEKKKDSISCGKKEIWRELLTPRCVFHYVLKGAFQMQRTIQKLKWWIQMECYYYLQVVVAEKWMSLNWLILVVSVLFRYQKCMYHDASLLCDVLATMDNLFFYTTWGHETISVLIEWAGKILY